MNVVIALLAVLASTAAPARGAGPASSGAAAADVARATARMTTANRTSGIAPLAVFFDAVDTLPSGPASPFAWTSGVQQPADGDYERMNYAWTFGDPGAGAWSTTGLSRNTATGYTAAHVYETPGVYTARLVLTDEAGTVRTYEQTITVAAFSGKTFHVAANGSDANPGTETRPFATLDRGVAAVKGGPNRRLLLRRGDTFSTRGVALDRGGPGAIGAYGSGSRPVLRVSGREGGIVISATDWRVLDLEIVGPGGAADESTGGVEIGGAHTSNALVMRVKTSAFRVGLGNSQSVNDARTPHDGNAWVENEVGDSGSGNMYAGGRRLAIMGNHLHDCPKTHLLRVYQMHKGVISNNRLWDPGPTRGALKLGGMGYGTAWARTEFVTVSDNLVRGDTWSVSIGPQNTVEDERLSHVVVERNRFWSKRTVQADVVVEAQHVTIRNNVFDATGSYSTYRAVFLMTRHVGPGLDTVRILNNTVVQRDASSAVHVAECEQEPREDTANVTIANNILWAPRTPTRSLVLGTCGPTGFVTASNLLSDPRFTDPAREDYSLQPGSPAIDSGTARADVREDFARAPRPAGAATDVGAYERR